MFTNHDERINFASPEYPNYPDFLDNSGVKSFQDFFQLVETKSDEREMEGTITIRHGKTFPYSTRKSSSVLEFLDFIFIEPLQLCLYKNV